MSLCAVAGSLVMGEQSCRRTCLVKICLVWPYMGHTYERCRPYFGNLVYSVKVGLTSVMNNFKHEPPSRIRVTESDHDNITFRTRMGHSIEIPTSRVSVFILGRVFALFMWLMQSVVITV